MSLITLCFEIIDILLTKKFAQTKYKKWHKSKNKFNVEAGRKIDAIMSTCNKRKEKISR
jgi:hypothetical protein